MKRGITKNTLFFVFIAMIESLMIKMVQFRILPQKYFYDSNKILEMINSGIRYNDRAYDFAADVFSKINIFHFNTLQQWSIAIGLIFSIIIAFILVSKKKYSIKEMIFILASIGLLNIYVFNLSKDIIQFVFILIIYVIAKNKKITNFKKMIISCVIFLIESLYFRSYYAIMAMLIFTIYYIYLVFIKNKKINKQSVLKIIFISVLLFFVEIFIVQKISLDNYNLIMNARSSVNFYRENSLDANTIINNLLGNNTNFIIFIGNYIINLIRLLFPLELLFKGYKYIIFIIYQLFITIVLLKNSRAIQENNIFYVILFISSILMSAIFEPDFGSFIRHESAMTLILIELVSNLQNYSKIEQREIMQDE